MDELPQSCPLATYRALYALRPPRRVVPSDPISGSKHIGFLPHRQQAPEAADIPRVAKSLATDYCCPALMTVSREILELRWETVRHAMRQEGLDVLVVPGRSGPNTYGGFTYIAGVTPSGNCAYAILTLGDEPLLIVPTHHDEVAAQECGLRAQVGSSREASALAAATASGDTIGVVGLKSLLSVEQYESLCKGLHSLTPHDASDLLARVKSHKTSFEIQELRDAFSVAMAALEAAPPLLRPGAPTQKIIAELERLLRARGACYPIVYVDSDPHFARTVSRTTLRDGDLVTVLVEMATADGFWVELGALFALGTLSPRHAALADALYKALAAARSILKPGLPTRAVWETVSEIAAATGFQIALGLGHGIGIDSDMPILAQSSEGFFEVGHVISLHPNLEDHEAQLGALLADGFLVTDHGAVSLSGFAQELCVL